ncbi:signal peptidase I SipW [Cytobacillus horneckiae]|uniref:signal peptidase I SipW n=1 Tax=Cytobacillus horneckiae TaxID=549687 RepID=UPI003D2167BF
MRKIGKLIITTFSNLLFVLLCIFLFIVVSSRLSGSEPALFGYQMKTVLSGSMEPTFKTGSVITINTQKDADSYQTGDIITFKIDNYLVTHRIEEVSTQNGTTVYKTKGDNNNGADLWTVPAFDIVGEYTGFSIPYLGYMLSAAQSKEGTALIMIIPGLYFLVTSFRSTPLPQTKEVLN